MDKYGNVNHVTITIRPGLAYSPRVSAANHGLPMSVALFAGDVQISFGYGDADYTLRAIDEFMHQLHEARVAYRAAMHDPEAVA